jgi:3-mercaptopyruvate sulfurtransferase SseA
MRHTVVNEKYIVYNYIMVAEDDWQKKAKRLLKAEIARAGLSYRDLVARLGAMGIKETEQNIANKLSRGGFSAVFMLQVLEAAGCKKLTVSED